MPPPRNLLGENTNILLKLWKIEIFIIHKIFSLNLIRCNMKYLKCLKIFNIFSENEHDSEASIGYYSDNDIKY